MFLVVIKLNKGEKMNKIEKDYIFKQLEKLVWKYPMLISYVESYTSS